jgi:hypothetical protein
MRNPAMPWYRVIDEATWKAFHEAAGNPATLHEHLVDLLTNPELPWLTIDKSRELGDMVGRQTLRRRGVSSYTTTLAPSSARSSVPQHSTTFSRSLT